MPRGTAGSCSATFPHIRFKHDPGFLHQHAGGKTRNIAVSFGLIGLYLALERGYTGRQVQLAHIQIAKARKLWPRMDPPAHPASITVQVVLKEPEGPERDAMIHRWMASVWESWADRQQWVRKVKDDTMGRR